MKIDIIIYTKDRAMQLELLLRSMKNKFKNIGDVYIIYTCSNDFFGKGYFKLFYQSDKCSGCHIISQINFEEDVKNIIKNMQSEYILGLCDDDIFTMDTDCTDIIRKLHDNDVSSISLKHGLNITSTYINTPRPFPEFIEKEPYLKWDWTTYYDYDTWGYPTCINSYIYLKDYFWNLIKDNTFQQPTTLEGSLNTNKKKFKKHIVSFQEMKLLNTPVNRIQTLSPNYFGTEFSYTIEDLNQKYLDSYIIDTSNIYGIKVNKNNKEVEFKFING